MAWYEQVTTRLPRGASSFGVDSDAGVLVLVLVLQPDHDAEAVQALLDQLPADAVVVRISDERWYAGESAEANEP
ncbi:hypothetical protein [Nitriliruptor alkaliphilus]|uniref:hypothetical protein n=1 Tax=Nitriliruptor alkaliphilus TaxID=427918 RepID=UPI0012ECDB57|nr:hypothetical protein [Nitriliruptor alkaliphilus]